MAIVSDLVLLESKSARNNQLEQMTHDRAYQVLCKAKALLVALWQGTGVTTTDEIAHYYEVESSVVRHASKQHRDELISDGWREVKGKEELKALRSTGCEVFSLPDATTRIAIWTPRAALRLGMVLRDSDVAAAVRTSLLDAAEQVIPAQYDRIRELELENNNLALQLELARARTDAARAEDAAATSQERLLAVSNAIATLHGAGMLGLMLGKPEAIVESPPTIVEKTVLVNSSGRPVANYQGLSKTKLAKRYGMKKAADFITWLQSVGKADLLQSGLTAAPCQYVPYEFVAELDRLWASRQGFRQRLIGE